MPIIYLYKWTQIIITNPIKSETNKWSYGGAILCISFQEYNNLWGCSSKWREVQGLVSKKKKKWGKAVHVQTWLTRFWSHGPMFLRYTLLSSGCTGNMQLWQVNQRKHLFASWKQKGGLDGLLSMQTTGCGYIYLFCPWGGPIPGGGPVPPRDIWCACFMLVLPCVSTCLINRFLLPLCALQHFYWMQLIILYLWFNGIETLTHTTPLKCCMLVCISV